MTHHHISETVEQVPLDRLRSPLTGWTRAHHEAVATHALLALRPWGSERRARFNLPGPNSNSGVDSDALEAFARSFLAVGNLLATKAPDPHDFAGWYADGIAAGVDPASPERWPRLEPAPQARVEAAALAMALHSTRHAIWDQLTSSTQEQLVDWLAESGRVGYPRSNWVLFFTVTQAFLRSVGAPTDEARIDEYLDMMEGCHLGGGWYADGPFGPGERPRGPQVDWYNSYVIHHFFARYAAMTPDLDPARRELWRERLGGWANDAICLFGADGGPLFQGRSLIYRFGVLAALLDAGGAEVGPSPGQIRRVASGTMRYFVDHGAFNEDGILTMGWHGEHDRMRQTYSGPGSPYWGMHGFSGLLWDADHPLWSATEEPAPIEAGDIRLPIAGPAWLAIGDQGITRVFNAGIDHVQAGIPGPDPLYDRLAHSTATAPAELTSPDQIGCNRVVLTVAGRRWDRRLIVWAEVDQTSARSRWMLDEGPESPVVTGVSVPRDSIEVRLIRIDSLGAGAEVGDATSTTVTTSGWPVPAELGGPMAPLIGSWGASESAYLDQPMAPEVRVAELSTHAGPGEWVAVGVALTTDADPPAWPQVTLGDPEPDGTVTATIRWADHEDLVQLPPTAPQTPTAPA